MTFKVLDREKVYLGLLLLLPGVLILVILPIAFIQLLEIEYFIYFILLFISGFNMVTGILVLKDYIKIGKGEG